MTETTNIHFTPIDADPRYGVNEAGEVINFSTNRILKLTPTSMGYFMFNAGRKVALTVHREVAKIYVRNPNNYPVVNHIDGNKQNNHYTNLEWTTYSANAQHAYDIGLSKSYWEGKFGKDHVTSKPIIQYNTKGDFVKEWENARQAQREDGFHPARICEICKGKRKTHKGFIFKFK